MKLNSISPKKKEAIRIASRFLKEVGLYDLWIKYRYDNASNSSYGLNKSDDRFTLSDILGNTNFTRFVVKHGRWKCSYICICDILGAYINGEYPQYVDKGWELRGYESAKMHLVVDKEEKKIEII
jgi:hypothetical protein